MRALRRFISNPLFSILIVSTLPACGSDGSTGPGNGGNGGNTGSGNAPTAVIVANPTSVPVNDAGNTVVTLDGSQSSDPDGGSLTFAWNVEGVLQFVNGTTASSEIAQVTFPGAAPYSVTLTVTDGENLSDSASTVIQLDGGGQ